jgi:hypothetical protein
MTPSPDPVVQQKEAMSLTNRDPNRASSGVSMDLMSMIRLMLRHWRVTGPAVVATVLLVVTALMMAAPTYSASASVALFSPPDVPEVEETPAVAPPVGQNPFSRYGDLSVVADIVARKMDSEAVRAELKAQGVAGYEVVANRIQRGPLIEVTGTGPSAAAAISAAEEVVAAFDAVLLEMQQAEGADPNYVISSGPVESPETAVAQVGSTLRTVIAVVAVGGLGTLGVAVAAEAFTRRRTAAKGRAEVPEPDVAAGPADGRPSPLSGSGRIVVPPERDPAPAPVRPQSGAARPVTTVYRPADTRSQWPLSGGGRTAPEPSDPGSGARADAPNGSRRRDQWVVSLPDVDRPNGKQADRVRWPSSTEALAPENGHEKPATDHKS